MNPHFVHIFLAYFSIGNIFSGIGTSIGNYFKGIVLTGFEQAVKSALSAIFEVLSGISNGISNILGQFLLSVSKVAASPILGLFGPVMAGLLLLAIFVVGIVFIRLLIDIA